MPRPKPPAQPNTDARSSPWEVLAVFLRLGLTAFGGPVAHLAYFRDDLVLRRAWLSERSYTDVVALCQFLPGPASSQVGLTLGWMRAGPWGALAAWVGFTLPSALLLTALALGLAHTSLPQGTLHGLKLVATAVVAQAVWGMAQQFCTDARRWALMVLATAGILWLPSVGSQVLVLALAAGLGWWSLPASQAGAQAPLPHCLSPRWALFWGGLWGSLLLALPLLAQATGSSTLQRADAFFRAGSLVFGGGHVVLPWLQSAVVVPGWVDSDVFLAGYGAAQAVPGPLFTLAAFLGARMAGEPSGWLGAALALGAIFAPSFLLVAAALPFWERLRRHEGAQRALLGVNVAVVGLLLAALLGPVAQAAVHTVWDGLAVVVATVVLLRGRVPAWALVLLGAVAGAWLLN